MTNLNTRVAAVLIHEGALLVMRRVKGDMKYATIPGGTVEQGETPEQALHREIQEECTLQITKLHHLITLDLPQGRESFYSAHITSSIAEMMISGPEHTLYQPGSNEYHLEWVPLPALPALNLLPPEFHQFLLRHLETLTQN